MDHSITNSVMSSVQRRTPTKRSKPKNKNKDKNKPIKVVYISNPMKVKTSASGFRALVQELTGQDAESPPDPSRFQHANGDHGGGGGGVEGGHQMDSDNCNLMKVGHDESDHTVVVPPQVDPDNNSQGQPAGGGTSVESFEPFDDVFTSQMMENISAFLPASVFYECAQVDQMLMAMQCSCTHQ